MIWQFLTNGGKNAVYIIILSMFFFLGIIAKQNTRIL